MRMSTKPCKAFPQSSPVSSAFSFWFHHGVRLCVKRTLRAVTASLALRKPAFEQNAFGFEGREFSFDGGEPRAHRLADMGAEFLLRTLRAGLYTFHVTKSEPHLLGEPDAAELGQRTLVIFAPATFGLQRPVDEAFAFVESDGLHAHAGGLGDVTDPLCHRPLHGAKSGVRTMLRMQGHFGVKTPVGTGCRRC